MTRYSQNSVPFVSGMLKNLCRNVHFRQTIPKFEHLFVFPEAYLPSVRARAKWKHGERVGEGMYARLQPNIVFRPSPHQLTIHIEQGNTVMSAADGLGDLHNK